MIEALIDTNVAVAILVDGHMNHNSSFALLGAGEQQIAIAAHSYAEAYNTLTRKNGVLAYPPDQAWAALEHLRRFTVLLGLTPTQTLEGIRAYAQSSGIGPRLYDRLIGEVAVVHGIPAIVTWNVGHMRSLFPALTVVTPAEWLEDGKG